MPTTTRGPLPPGVYWRRRLAILSVALVLVLGVGKLLGRGSDGDAEPTAERAGALSSPTATVTEDPSASPTKKKGKGKGAGKGGKGNGGKATPTPTPTPTPTTPPPLPEPTGPCAEDDVFVTATVDSAIGGSDVTFLLNLQARTSPACSWTVSPETVSMTIARGKDTVWSSEQCPDAIAPQDVVVRQASVTQVPVVWKNAQRSDPECTGRTAWALPNVYTVSTASLGGEPTEVQFELTAPAPPTVVVTVTPTPSATPTP